MGCHKSSDTSCISQKDATAHVPKDQNNSALCANTEKVLKTTETRGKRISGGTAELNRFCYPTWSSRTAPPVVWLLKNSTPLVRQHIHKSMHTSTKTKRTRKSEIINGLGKRQNYWSRCWIKEVIEIQKWAQRTVGQAVSHTVVKKSGLQGALLSCGSRWDNKACILKHCSVFFMKL